MTRGRVSIALDVARHAQHDFGILVNAQIVHKKGKKKPHLSDKNVKVCLDFARVHKH